MQRFLVCLDEVRYLRAIGGLTKADMKCAVGHPSRPRAGLVAGLLAALVIALSAPPRAMAVSTDNDCLVWAAKYTLVEQSKFSLVFSKFNPHVKSDGPTYYGCVFSREKARVLARQGEGGTLSQFELKGRYVAYADVFHDPAVAESSGRILVFDAADNKTKVDQPAWPDQPGLPGGERGFSRTR